MLVEAVEETEVLEVEANELAIDEILKLCGNTLLLLDVPDKEELAVLVVAPVVTVFVDIELWEVVEVVDPLFCEELDEVFICKEPRDQVGLGGSIGLISDSELLVPAPVLLFITDGELSNPIWTPEPKKIIYIEKIGKVNKGI